MSEELIEKTYYSAIEDSDIVHESIIVRYTGTEYL